MKPLTPQQLQALTQVLSQTRDREYTCSEYQAHTGELAERRLAGLPAGEPLAPVEQHLALCSQCREEFDALLAILSQQK